MICANLYLSSQPTQAPLRSLNSLKSTAVYNLLVLILYFPGFWTVGAFVTDPTQAD